jgi:hypothetical protein
MRTTLELDDELLAGAKRIASQEGLTLGRVISDLARRALAAGAPPKVRNGVVLLAPKPHARRANLRLVNELRDAS